MKELEDAILRRRRGRFRERMVLAVVGGVVALLLTAAFAAYFWR